MKRLKSLSVFAVIAALIFLANCIASVNNNQLTANQVLDGLKKANIPVTEETNGNTETDEKQVKGDKDAISERIFFSDNRARERGGKPHRNSLEIYKSAEAAIKNKNETEAFLKDRGMSVISIFNYKNVVLILDSNLLKNEVGEYEKILKTL